jgi:uncharacterized membrane protein
VLAAYSDAAYDIVLVLHILCAIIGFGSVMLNAIYGQQAKSRRGREGLAIFQANKLVSTIGRYFIYAVFVLGILLVLLGGKTIDFDQTWIWLSMLLFIGAIGVSHGLLLPRVNRIEALMTTLADGPPPTAGGGPPAEAAQIEAAGKQLGIISMVLDLTMVVILILMVTKPGSPLT